MDTVFEILESLDAALVAESAQREKDGVPGLSRACIQILGQMSLVLNPDVAKRLELFATQDVDAVIRGDWIVTRLFKAALEAQNLQFDFHSTDIWLPPDAKYIPIFSGQMIDCEILDPVSALTSKAIKAPDKNHLLIGEALKVYGEELAEKIRTHGGDPARFKLKLTRRLRQ
jgi:hypothetical protein